MVDSRQFKRQQRLLTAKDFKQVFQSPYKLADRYFTVLSRFNGQANARLGLAIAKKQVKKAVSRNRIKRLVRESFRHHQHLIFGLDCVVLARQGVGQVDNSTLFRSLAAHWQQLAQRCKNS